MQTNLKLNLLLFQLEFDITRLVTELKFYLKFNLFLVPIIVAGYTATSSVVWWQVSANAERDFLDKGRIMLETAQAMRTYTTNQVAPLLDREQSQAERTDKSLDQFLNTRLPEAMTKAIAQMPTAREQQALQGAAQRLLASARQERRDATVKEFLPQSIPFFAATEAFNYFRQHYPAFSYKEATLNPTNPRDRTSDWERDVVDMFRNDASRKESVGRRETPAGPMLYVSTPIRADMSCLECHGLAVNAPPELLRRYGPDNGFGWTLNDVVGAQIVSIPAQLAQDHAVATQRTIMIWLGGVLAGCWALVNLLVYVFHKRNAFANPLAPSAAAAG
jgi:Protein of unknown function (DUF3365)